MATYKVDSVKAQSIILAVRPRIVFINGPPGINATDFVEPFKHAGFNVAKITANTSVASVKKRLDMFKAAPTILWGQIQDARLLSDMFSDYPVFTYVYIYPSNAKQYMQNLVKIYNELNEEDQQGFIKEIQTYTGLRNLEIDKFAKASMKKCSEIYKSHLDYFGHMLVSLF